LKLLFDGRAFQFQKAGGINRYFAEVIKGLPSDWNPVITGVSDFGENIPRHPNLHSENPPQFRPARFRHRFHRDWWRPRLARSFNLVHPTYYDLTCGFKLADFKCPVVTTVYDMVHARFPDKMEGAAATIREQREAVIRADRVICISRSTEQELLELVPEAAGKTKVIHLGSSFAAATEPNDNNRLETPRFLYVGGRGGYKNFLFLLRAFAKASSTLSAIRLHVAGPPLTPEERWQIYFLGIADKVDTSAYPNESTLQDLYGRSVALLYPSRYEGFGIPPLEAMACGTIPVTGNTTSLPEVVGDAGIMLDPADESAWAECIISLGRPFPARSDLLERGRRQAARFSWAESARRHVEIYRELAGL
jgi:glycosyltransferase involved in cell wall biosynthesis